MKEAKIPVENERKAILDPPRPSSFLFELVNRHGGRAFEITQGYLTGSARIRHIVPHDTASAEQYLFTYKTRVAGSTVEIETEISLHDYHKLLTVVKKRINKTRVKVPFGNDTWEIDFLKEPKSGTIYIVIAEIELPEFIYEPEAIPPFVNEHLLFRVPRGDNRFQNKNLTVIPRVAKLLKQVRSEQMLRKVS